MIAFAFTHLADPRRKELFVMFGKKNHTGCSHDGCLHIILRLPRFWFDYTEFYPDNNTYDSYCWTGREREFRWDWGSLNFYLRAVDQRQWNFQI